jgi:anti-sigma B factor antagonist
MNVAKKQNGSELFIEVSGSIDTVTAPELNKILNESLKGINSLIFDFANVDYISSAGLRVLLAARKSIAKDGSVVVRNSNQNILDIFAMTGFDNILTIE